LFTRIIGEPFAFVAELPTIALHVSGNPSGKSRMKEGLMEDRDNEKQTAARKGLSVDAWAVLLGLALAALVRLGVLTKVAW
jgi:hypothetical protein